MANGWIDLPVESGGSGTGVSSLDGMTGALTLVAGSGITIVDGAGTITISSTGGGGSGTVTSVALTVPAFLSVSGSPITSSGTLGVTLSGTALPVANGGTGTTTVFTTGSVIFADGSGNYAQNNANFFWDNTNNRLGIGNAVPAFSLDIVNNTAAGAQALQTTGYGTGSNGFRGLRARGTVGSPAAVQANDLLSFYSGKGYGATAFSTAATGAFQIAAEATFTDTSMPTDLRFLVTPVGSVTSAEAMRIAPTGNVLIGKTTDDASHIIQANGTILGTGVTTGVGGAGTPTINFLGDLTTGLYQGGAGVIGFTSAGVSTGTISGTALTLAANKNFTMNSGTGQISQTYSGTSVGAAFTGVTTQSGNLVTVTSSATAAINGDAGLMIALSGANTNTAVTRYGIRSSVTTTNATSGTNVAGYFSATGALTGNYGIVVAAGNSGFGTVTPTAPIDVNGYGATATVTIPQILATSSTNGVTGMELKNTSSSTAADTRFALVENGGTTFVFTHPGSGNTGTLFGLTRSTASYIFTGRIMALGTTASVAMTFSTNNSEKMRISGTGLVGIGNNNPTYLLDVLGGNVGVGTAGDGYRTKEGSNAKQGTATLAAGTVTVANTSVTATSRIFLTAQSLGTVAVPQAIAVTARTAGTSFTITSAGVTDTSVIAYEIFEPY